MLEVTAQKGSKVQPLIRNGLRTKCDDHLENGACFADITNLEYITSLAIEVEFMAAFLFIFSIVMICYVYVGYPLMAAGLAAIRNRRVQRAPVAQKVTILIAAYNEKSVIADTIKNKLEQDYPVEMLDILVVSDGSTDGTDEIVRGINDSRVKLLLQEPRAGKTSALNLAMPHAQGDIIVFSDANSIYAPDAIRQLVATFADPEVGYVTGRMTYVDNDGSFIGDGCNAYMKYENTLRAIESRLGSIVGVDGGIDAVRKELYQPMRPDELPDFILPLKVVEQGYRVVYEPNAVLMEPSLTEAKDEYQMRVRVSLRAIWALFSMRHLLVGQRNAVFSWQLWSHKVLRYFCFAFLFTMFFCNFILLSKGLVYWILFLLQISGYLIAIFGPSLAHQGFNYYGIINMLRYFVLINVASAHAFFKFLLGKKQVLWTPRKG